MPLIVLAGLPSSGKTTRCDQIRKYFQNMEKNVHVVSENDIILEQKIEKNALCFGE